MKSLTSGIIVLGTGLLLLGACSKEAKTNDPASTTAAAPQAETAAPTTATNPMANEKQSHMSPKKGGQVVESGKYHLELVPATKGDSTILDFYLLKGDKHEPIANAKVTADVQSPDGKQKTLLFSSYNAGSKNYTTVVSDKATGQYQVKIIATVGSEKVNGRFNFDR